MKSYVIGAICFLLVAGTFLKAIDGAEEEPFRLNDQSPLERRSWAGERLGRAGVVGQVVALIEEQKVYLATPKKTFQYYCGPCHGKSADGKGIFFTIDLTPLPRDLTDVEYMAGLTDEYLKNFITKGSAAMEKSDLCPPWGNTLDEDRIKGIIAYLRNLTISKSKKGEKPAEKKEAEAKKVAEGRKKGTPKAVIWSVLILLCSFFVFATIREWKKLNIEKTSRKK